MAPTTQKALTIPAEKEPFKLVTGWPVPQPSPTDVLVKLVSVALNPVDAFVQAQGGHDLVPGYLYVAGFDGTGIVEEVGAEVTNVAKGDKVLVQGTFNNIHTTFQKYTLQLAKYVGKIPDNITFDQAATISLCLATVVTGIWVDEEDSRSEAGQTSGSTPSSARVCKASRRSSPRPPLKNEAFLKSLGAMHVIDRALSHDEIRAALPTNTPVTYVYDVFGRGRDHPQRLAYSDLVEESEQKGEGKRIARASYSFPGNRELGVEIFKRVTGWLETGAIVPSRVEVIPGGLVENDFSPICANTCGA
ncbi:GroES-like protein [Ganoderma leucocontextum]|nr:GroES-like protein [Ganoderma leucocontextum]